MQLQQQQQQMMMQQQALQAQPTGFRSNNPFAPMAAQHTAMPSMFQQQQQQQPEPFIPAPVSQPQQQPEPPKPAPQPTYQAPPKKDDGEHARLAALLANRDGGMDTFGNVGNMRESRASLRTIKDVLMHLR